jgi:hypothetical protein
VKSGERIFHPLDTRPPALVVSDFRQLRLEAFANNFHHM